MFEGAITALVTPFKRGEVDEKALVDLIEFQIAGGIHGLVPCGTTGESPTLTHDEHDRVIEITIKAAKKRVPVIAGTGSNSTAEALRLTRHAYEAGADGALIACCDSEVSPELVRATAKRGPLRAVFRDSGFASDDARINAEQIFREISPATDVKAI